jgi:AraC-like DNA-binding protein
MRPRDLYFTFGLASLRGEPRQYEEFHRHNEIELQYVERGAFTQLLSSGRFTVSEGQFAVLWGAMPHRLIHVEPRTVLHWLTVPLAWFLEWQLPDAITRPLLDGEVLRDSGAGRSASDLLLFTQWHADLKRNSAAARKVVLLEAEARLRRMRPNRSLRSAQQHPPHRSVVRLRAKADSVPDAGGLGKVELMAAYVAEHYRGEISVPEIARAVGLHPDYAVTLFRKSCGMGLVDYITQHRVSHAQRLLSTTNHKILDVAFASGFGSASRFYAAFAQLCKQSPKEYRRDFSVAL